MLINSDQNYTNKILNNQNDKAIVLFFGLALWLFIPILGIFPLILFTYLNSKSKGKLNFVITLLVILTITVFVSSLDIISDLAVYIKTYGQLSTQTPWEISGAEGFEFVLWLASYPIYLISNGSNYAFIFFWSFFFNALMFWVIAKRFSPQHYGLLLLFIVSNPIYIGFQGFLVRQYLATLIFLLAVINIDKKLIMWGLYLLSLLTHMANIIYLPILLLYKKAKLLNNKITLFLVLSLGIVLPFSENIFVNLADKVASFLPTEYAAIILGKTIYYTKDRVNESSFIVPLIEHLTIFMIIYFLLKDNKLRTAKDKIIYSLYPILFLLMFLGKDIHMFSNRVAFLLFPLGGLFYYLLIERKWKIFKTPIIVFILTCKLIYFNYFLHSIAIGENDFHFLDDKVYSSSIVEYVKIAAHNFSEDVRIKKLPSLDDL